MFPGLGMLKGLVVTLQNFIIAPFTVQYPDRRLGLLDTARALDMSVWRLVTQSPMRALSGLLYLRREPTKERQHSRFRGNEFTWFEERCTGCAACAKYCPLGIIEIVTKPGGVDEQEGESYAIDVFDIDAGRCMYCGLCVEACPYDALHMGTNFERASASRVDLVISKEQLNANAKHPSSWYRPQMERDGYDPYDTPITMHKDAGRHEKPTDEDLEQKWVDQR